MLLPVRANQNEGIDLFPLRYMRRSSRNPWIELRAIDELTALYRQWRPNIAHHVAAKPVIYGGLAAQRARVPAVVSALAGLGFVFTSASVEAVRCDRSCCTRIESRCGTALASDRSESGGRESFFVAADRRIGDQTHRRVGRRCLSLSSRRPNAPGIPVILASGAHVAKTKVSRVRRGGSYRAIARRHRPIRTGRRHGSRKPGGYLTRTA